MTDDMRTGSGAIALTRAVVANLTVVETEDRLRVARNGKTIGRGPR